MSRLKAKSEVAGSVWKIVKQPGDVVTEGDVLMIIESMKMEIPVLAEQNGTVIEVLTDEGSPVAEGDTVMLLEVG